jgi:hypothetical protein
MRQYSYDEVVMDTTVDTTKTSASQVPQWARYASVFIPDIINAAVTMEIMEENKATAAKASGVEATWVDISHMIRAMPPNCFIRFVQGAAETGGSALTYKIYYRGA